MSESKFTRGPWRYDWESGAVRAPTSKNDYSDCVASYVGEDDGNLIAAAPELYDALTYALPIVEKYAHTQGDNAAFHAEITAPIRAALLKATPEQSE